MTMTLVSIITPTYNHEKFIAQCIESVLAQSFHDWEQIIIDDESTDKTPEIIQHYNDPRIRYFRVNHKGLSNLVKIYNEGLRLSRGEIIAILEGDDFWPSDKIEKEIVAFESQEVILAWGNGFITNELGVPLYLRHTINISDIRQDYSGSEMLRIMRRDNPLTPTSTIMIRKKSLIEIGGFQPSPSGIFVDISTWIKLAGSNQGIFHFSNSILGFWRTHKTQATFSGRVQQLLDHAMIVRQQEIEGSYSYSFYLEARAKLIACDWNNAQKLYIKLIFENDIQNRDKILCILGILSTVVRFDLIDFLINIKNYIYKRKNYIKTSFNKIVRGIDA